jgi:hypothetical protein
LTSVLNLRLLLKETKLKNANLAFSIGGGLYITNIKSRGWWCTFVIPAFGRRRQEDCKFEASMGYTVRLLSSKTKLKKLLKCRTVFNRPVSEAKAYTLPQKISKIFMF